MLSGLQLDEVKAKLEGGRSLQEIISTDYSGEVVPRVRRQLVEKFTAPVIQPIIVNARLAQMSVDDLNTKITQMTARLVSITAIRDAKL